MRPHRLLFSFLPPTSTVRKTVRFVLIKIFVSGGGILNRARLQATGLLEYEMIGCVG